MENYRFLIIIILYRQTLRTSSTIQSIQRCQGLLPHTKVIVWDNSPERASDEEVAAVTSLIAGLHYVKSVDNRGIARVYNQAITENPDVDYVITFDQDSTFGEQYFLTLLKAMSRHSRVTLFLPLVRSAGILISPADHKVFKGKYWREERTGLMSARSVLAISSGMVMARSYFEDFDFYFNEKLKLYGVDTDFMIHYSRNADSLVVFDYSLQHESFWVNESVAAPEEIIERFSSLCEAWKEIYSFSPARSVLIRLFIAYKSLRMAARYRDARFLK